MELYICTCVKHVTLGLGQGDYLMQATDHTGSTIYPDVCTYVCTYWCIEMAVRVCVYAHQGKCGVNVFSL